MAWTGELNSDWLLNDCKELSLMLRCANAIEVILCVRIHTELFIVQMICSLRFALILWKIKYGEIDKIRIANFWPLLKWGGGRHYIMFSTSICVWKFSELKGLKKKKELPAT